jgi:succinate dehydrogenase / fumarate reductase, cytochrome b subunit
MTAATKSVTAPPSFSRTGVLWASTVGKKALMALTGILLSLFVLGHMLGNLQLYFGKDSTGAYLINKYADFLHNNKGLLYGTRIVLFVAVLIHVIAAFQLQLGKGAARPIDYHQKESVNSTVSSRYMFWTGVIIFAFVIYHLLQLTLGAVNVPAFKEGDVFHNVTVGLRTGVAPLFYIVGMIGLGLHLRHGLYSLFQSLGAGNPAVSQWALKWAAVVATVIALVNLSFPLAVLAGLVKG